VFASDEDFAFYRANLIECKRDFGCKIYAYCLMTNHIHLVIDPGEKPESLSLFMKRVAGRQTRYVNRLHKRSGSLWEGRFKSSIISTREYLLACCRFVEQNPVRYGLVAAPESYRWSSYAGKALGVFDDVVDFDCEYIALAKTVQKRQAAYAAFVKAEVAEDEVQLIRQVLQRGQLTGSALFREQVYEDTGIFISRSGPGRPRKEKE
jgi:putative transposase